MELFKRTNIDFMSIRWPAIWLSSLVNLIGIGSFIFLGFNFGLDFTGGTVVEVGYEQPANLVQVRSALTEGGFKEAGVQHFGSTREVLIRLPPVAAGTGSTLGDRVIAALSATPEVGKIQLRRVEFVGSQVGGELVEQGGLAILYTLIGILIYVAIRFEWRFAVGAVIATVHDVIVVLAVFSLFQIEFDLTALAAVLAIIGYSLNDTVVIYDRIRENFRKVRKGTVLDVVDLSINETLSRTIITHGVTMLAVLALFFLGGQVIHGFALAFIVGIFTGTYSSIYVASSSVVLLGISRADLLPVPKEGPGVDARP
ncbi:protein translocase subunit SecF [uncultured Thiodictyon sp.]|uniref:protein translocase subunit SecF n=1 Tax=uncultured Thiodictyon sp. TaxID=1846217 RepID=UPI0025CC4B38|nr:protein translocase subunit SecF [uncultured Thiodictyon sp.]